VGGYGGKEGPTIIIWKSLSEREKASWLEEEVRRTTGLCGATQKKGQRTLVHSMGSKRKRFDDESKPEDEKNTKNKSKKSAYHGQNVQYRSWWKEDNIKMAVSDAPASCWDHKDLTVTTKKIRCC